MSELHYMPLLNVKYFKSLNSLENIEVENAIKISLMMVTGFREILDELNFDELISEEELEETKFLEKISFNYQRIV